MSRKTLLLLVVVAVGVLIAVEMLFSPSRAHGYQEVMPDRVGAAKIVVTEDDSGGIWQIAESFIASDPEKYAKVTVNELTVAMQYFNGVTEYNANGYPLIRPGDTLLVPTPAMMVELMTLRGDMLAEMHELWRTGGVPAGDAVDTSVGLQPPQDRTLVNAASTGGAGSGLAQADVHPAYGPTAPKYVTYVLLGGAALAVAFGWGIWFFQRRRRNRTGSRPQSAPVQAAQQQQEDDELSAREHLERIWYHLGQLSAGKVSRLLDEEIARMSNNMPLHLRRLEVNPSRYSELEGMPFARIMGRRWDDVLAEARDEESQSGANGTNGHFPHGGVTSEGIGTSGSPVTDMVPASDPGAGAHAR